MDHAVNHAVNLGNVSVAAVAGEKSNRNDDYHKDNKRTSRQSPS